MARKRMIDPSFWTDEKLGECTRDERLLFMGLISNADDEGYGRANSKLLKSTVFPYDDIRACDLDKWLAHLNSLRLIALYAVCGQMYYHLPNFLKHQTINKPTPSSLPKPEEGETGVLPIEGSEPDKKKDKPDSPKTAYGEFKNVQLTAQQHVKLVAEGIDVGAYIERLDGYMQQSAKNKARYSDHYATILNWWRKDGKPTLTKTQKPTGRFEHLAQSAGL